MNYLNDLNELYAFAVDFVRYAAATKSSQAVAIVILFASGVLAALKTILDHARKWSRRPSARHYHSLVISDDLSPITQLRRLPADRLPAVRRRPGRS